MEAVAAEAEVVEVAAEAEVVAAEAEVAEVVIETVVAAVVAAVEVEVAVEAAVVADDDGFGMRFCVCNLLLAQPMRSLSPFLSLVCREVFLSVNVCVDDVHEECGQKKCPNNGG